jgi:CRISPR-associated endonuclease Csy4
MDHYIDIQLRADPETAPHQLMSALCTRLHRRLVAVPECQIGISFPGFETRPPALGKHLRLHGSAAALTELFALDWLAALRDHLQLSTAAAVPADATHRVVRRVQSRSNPERLRRRQMRRHGIDEAEARLRIPDDAAEYLRLPFVQMRSTSSAQDFRLFIEHGPALTTAVPGDFNRYGLSQQASVPWF